MFKALLEGIPSLEELHFMCTTSFGVVCCFFFFFPKKKILTYSQLLIETACGADLTPACPAAQTAALFAYKGLSQERRGDGEDGKADRGGLSAPETG